MNCSVNHSKFLLHIKDWAENLCMLIKQIKHKGNIPMLIALSRKMPRFIDWVIETKADAILSDDVIDTIKNTELTTELALPFIFFQSQTQKSLEFIIIDDFIIHGVTIRNVARDIFAITGQTCHLSCIFRLEGTDLIPLISLFEVSRIPAVSQKEADEFISIICKKVEASQLPIDMEFPIFDISSKNNNEFDKLKKDLSEVGLPTYEIGNKNDRFSVDLSKFRAMGRDNDFSKLRLFKKNQGVIIEAISPHLISNELLLSTKELIFQENIIYQKVWDECTYKIRCCLKKAPEGSEMEWEEIKTDFTRSLCVFANFLFSLSTFLFFRSLVTGEYVNRPLKFVKLNKKDLSLILGQRMALIIYSALNYICENGEIVRSMKDSVLTIPDSFSPDAYSFDWERHKLIRVISSQNINSALQSVFKYQHYTNPLFQNQFLNRGRLAFGESYQSLNKSIGLFFSNINLSIEICRWVDMSIDKGYVVPKYVKIKSTEGTTYWRRYFHAGCRRWNIN